jgi:hypothetical protein
MRRMVCSLLLSHSLGGRIDLNQSTALATSKSVSSSFVSCTERIREDCHRNRNLHPPAVARHAKAAESETAVQLGRAAIGVTGAVGDVERHQVIYSRMRHRGDVEAAVVGERGTIIGGKRVARIVLSNSGSVRQRFGLKSMRSQLGL